MTNYKIDRVQSVQILDKNTLEPIADLNGVGNVTTEIEPSSFKDEVLSFNHSASFQGTIDYNSALYSLTVCDNKPLYVEYYVPILIQARWHKKHRVNKKWLKRYGIKKDKLWVKCDIDNVTPENSKDPYNTVINFEFSNMKYKFRQDQLRKNLRIEMCC